MTPIWMTKDPETVRVSIQTREFTDYDFPLGLRGEGWECRTGEVDTVVWERLLRGELTPDEQDQLHHRLWNEGQT